MRGPIQAALDGHMAALVTDQVSWEGIPFEPTTGTLWYEATLLGGPERILSMHGTTPYVEQRGIYQVKVSAPTDVTAAGAGAINVKVDALTRHFHAGLTLSNGGVQMHLLGCTVAPAMATPRWYTLPVSIDYMAHYLALN